MYRAICCKKFLHSIHRLHCIISYDYRNKQLFALIIINYWFIILSDQYLSFVTHFQHACWRVNRRRRFVREARKEEVTTQLLLLPVCPKWDHERKIRSRRQRTDIGKYSSVNRTIQHWNRIPAEALGTLPCKPIIFKKRLRKVIIEVI